MINTAIQEIISKTLKKEVGNIQLIIIFGSAINSYFDINRSDIDIAFLSSAKISNVQRWEIQEKLASCLNNDIDLVDLNNSNDVLRFEIISKGKTLFIHPSDEIEYFLDSTYINYIQLNEDRAEIIQGFQ
jgi:predicted nucleotidyltransferase